LLLRGGSATNEDGAAERNEVGFVKNPALPHRVRQALQPELICGVWKPCQESASRRSAATWVGLSETDVFTWVGISEIDVFTWVGISEIDVFTWVGISETDVSLRNDHYPPERLG
jgi:hypothetical protein